MSDISEQRRYYERMMDEIDAVHRQQIDQLQAENAKLRKLCWCLFEWERVGGTSRDWRELQDCARELGVDA